MRKLLATLILSAICIFLRAQSINNYSVTRSSGVAYSSISSSGSAVNTWRYAGGFSQDDNRSYFMNIGFDFWYNGVRYSQLSVSTNGFIDFSNSTDDGGPTADDFGYVNSAFSASSAGLGTRPSCAVFYDDLTAQGGTEALGNSIRYQLSGTAPNRVFTIEWINMAVYTNTTPSLNFQVKLFESTGLIQYNYGTMNTGTFTFSYTVGINAPNLSLPPAAAELKNQITANTTTFTNTPQNNLSAMPTTNSRLVFSPPVPLNPTGTLTFSAVTQTSMTLNWTNWASNEVGYVLYNSTDGVNFTFVTQTAANATSQNVTGLVPGRTYFWRVFAVTEGALSTALTASQATLPAGNKVSNVVSGNWNTPGSWLPSGVPTATDNVTILDGHTITINTNTVCNRLTIGQGTSGSLRIGNNGTARTITVNENLIINSGADFSTNTASDATHLFSFNGNITNNGTLNFASDATSLCDFTFTRNGNQSVSGTGSSTFNLITLNMGVSEYNIASISTPFFTAANNFLTLSNGTLKLQNTNTVTHNIFTTAATTIGASCGLWFANPNATINIPNNITLDGNLRIDGGTVNLGDAINESLTSNGGELTITGGTFNVAGRYVSSTINNLSRFVMSGGTMVVPRIGSTSSTTLAPFNITSAGSVVIISGGRIIIPFEGGTGAQDLGYSISNVINSSVTGGTLQIGSALTPASQTMRINSVLPVGNLLINNGNATGLQAANLTVLNNVTITTGTLNSSTFNLNVGGNWTDNANFNPGTGTVTFNGSALQTITDPTGERYNNLTIGSTNTVQYTCDLDIDRNLVINAGSSFDASALSRTVDLQGNFTNNGTLVPRQGRYNFNGTTLQTMNAGSLTSFFDMNVQNTAGVTVASGTYELSGAYFPTTGIFNTSAATAFTLLSDALRTARIAEAGTGTVTGNFNVQRYISARAAGYSDVATPVNATTFADWDSELLLVYVYSPPFTYPSAWSYDEAAWDYLPVTASSVAITRGKGFEVYLDSYGTYTSFDNTTLDSRGNPAIGSVNISSAITFANDGWNLVGNPYASFISWDNVYASSTNIATDIMIYDEAIADFEIYSTGSAVELAPHQGFWVQATGSPTLVFNEAHKTSSFDSDFRNAKEALFTVKVSSLDKENWFTSSTKFTINGNSRFENDIRYKGIAHPLAPHLYAMNETGQGFRHKKLSTSTNDQIVPLAFESALNGWYKVDMFSIVNTYDLDYTCMYLHDKLLDKVLAVNEDFDGYKFYHDSNNDKSRFELVFIKNGDCPVTNENELNVEYYIGPQSTDVVVYSEGLSFNGTIALRNALGQLVGNAQDINNEGKYTVQHPLTSGVYLIETSINGISNVKKIVIP